MDWTRIGPPVDVRPPLPVVRADLPGLLGPLTSGQWARPTACPGWTVHHLAGHIAHDYPGAAAQIAQLAGDTEAGRTALTLLSIIR
jgi:hypothetical protein